MARKYPPVESLSAKELHKRLVDDAVAYRATPLEWAIAAYDRIARLTRTTAEQAYLDVRAEKKERTGNSLMPMG